MRRNGSDNGVHLLKRFRVVLGDQRAVRRDGYAIDREEATRQTWCVAAPILDYTGRTVAAVSLSTHSEPSPDDLNRLISAVLDLALKISQETGYRSHSAGDGLELQLRPGA